MPGAGVGVLHVGASGCDLPVAADNEVAAFVAHLLQMPAEQLEEPVLAVLLGVIALRCRGRQQATHRQSGEVSLNVATLHIEIGKAQTGHDGFGQFPAVDGHPVVFAAHIVEKVGVVAAGEVDLIAQIVLGTAQILNAHEVCVLAAEPGVKTALCRFAQAICAKAYDSHNQPLI